jgi:hypothetical protein
MNLCAISISVMSDTGILTIVAKKKEERRTFSGGCEVNYSHRPQSPTTFTFMDHRPWFRVLSSTAHTHIRAEVP